ncbi:hypothetical protein B5J93_04165 [Moraxella equi]|uniref:Uncharacterized protein n=2 Tax=Moraxella equi TaxID=60442 RepID=A0ABX3NJC8_9GAMM|nr:hypothetical protein B5J93_04165 [Moraxella equi]
MGINKSKITGNVIMGMICQFSMGKDVFGINMINSIFARVSEIESLAIPIILPLTPKIGYNGTHFK